MFDKKVLESLEEVKSLLRNKLSEILILKQENQRLIALNERLMDRLMARNFEELRIYQDSVDREEDQKELPLEYDETLAGEMVEVNSET